MQTMERVIDPGMDLVGLVGDVVALDLDGKAEDLPLFIGHFKITGTRQNKRGSFLVGYDEEMLKRVIPVERICFYLRLK